MILTTAHDNHHLCPANHLETCHDKRISSPILAAGLAFMLAALAGKRRPRPPMRQESRRLLASFSSMLRLPRSTGARCGSWSWKGSAISVAGTFPGLDRLEILAERAGHYVAELKYSCQDGSQGSTFRMSLGDQNFNARIVEGTGTV